MDVLALLVAVALLALLLAGLWRLARGPAGRRRWRVARAAGCVVVAIPLVLYGAYHLAKARTYQLVGEIVPRVDVRDKLVALTLDDGPTPGATERVLATLRERRVRATFFLIGSAMAEHPAQAAQIAAAGHELGNHTYAHRHMVGRSTRSIGEGLERTDSLIRSAGYAGPIHFRAPYGAKLLALPWVLWRSGRRDITWDVEPDSYPAVAASAEGIVRYVAGHARPGSIILLHVMYPGRATSLAAVPGVIDTLRAEGYRFVTVGELLRAGGERREVNGGR